MRCSRGVGGEQSTGAVPGWRGGDTSGSAGSRGRGVPVWSWSAEVRGVLGSGEVPGSGRVAGVLWCGDVPGSEGVPRRVEAGALRLGGISGSCNVPARVDPGALRSRDVPVVGSVLRSGEVRGGRGPEDVPRSKGVPGSRGLPGHGDVPGSGMVPEFEGFPGGQRSSAGTPGRCPAPVNYSPQEPRERSPGTQPEALPLAPRAPGGSSGTSPEEDGAEPIPHPGTAGWPSGVSEVVAPESTN